MPSDDRVERDFLARMQATFGAELMESVERPPGYRVGERMLYRMREGGTAERRPVDREGVEALLRPLADASGATLSVELPTDSGLPHPRIVDLEDCAIMYDGRIAKFFESDESLPSREFRLDWLIGLVDGADEDRLVYLDFTDPVVKALFSDVYRSRDDWDLSPRRTRDRFMELLARRAAEIRDRTSAGGHAGSCVKIVAGEEIPLRVHFLA